MIDHRKLMSQPFTENSKATLQSLCVLRPWRPYYGLPDEEGGRHIIDQLLLELHPCP